MSEPTEPNAKVLFRVPNEDGGADVETLWAYDLGSDKYKLDNLPYYAYGVSSDDVVLAPFNEDEGWTCCWGGRPLTVGRRTGRRMDWKIHHRDTETTEFS